MKKSRLLLLPAVLIIGWGLYFWGPFTGRQESVNFANAGEIVKAAQVKTGLTKSYRYKTDVSAGEQIKVAVQNRVIREDPTRQMVDFSWDIPKMSGMASMYTEGNKLYVFHPLKDKWLLPGEEPTIKPFLDFFRRQLDLVDPVENLLKLNPTGKNVSLYPEGNVKGEDTTAVLVIPEAGALSEISKALPPQFAGAELKDVKQFFWISKRDLLVTRYEVHAKVAFFGFKTMDFITVTTTDNYNKTEIDLPKQLQDKMNQAE